MSPALRVCRLGLLPYDEAYRWQQTCAEEVGNGAADALAIVEHPPVYTYGRRARSEHLKLTPAELELLGAELVHSDRGGDITFHGPGQLVGYPIVDLRRMKVGVAEYVHSLEETLLRALRRSGVWAVRVRDRRGVWLNGDKIGAIGVRVQGGVARHGFALNVDCDLSWFDHIVPCGIADAGVTSMRRALGYSPGMDATADAVVAAFEEVFGYDAAHPERTLTAAGGVRW